MEVVTLANPSGDLSKLANGISKHAALSHIIVSVSKCLGMFQLLGEFLSFTKSSEYILNFLFFWVAYPFSENFRHMIPLKSSLDFVNCEA